MTKILVADDAPDIRALLTEMLRNDGYEVVAATDGKRAVDLAAVERPDLILLDVMMPEMDGIDACRRLKSDPRLRNIPVILVTAKADDDDVILGLDVGADDYVTKPFRKEILAARVRSALRVKRDHDTILRINEQLRAEIADRKRMESELARAQRLESIGQLAAGIAHEINTPNQYIGDNVRFMQQAFAKLQAALRQAGMEQLAVEIPQAAQEALEGVQSVARTVRAMRAFAEAGARQKSPTNVPEAVENAIIVSRSQWKDVADVATDFDPRLPLVPCVPADLNEVILQLLRNAAWAIAEAARSGPPQKGTITVRARRDNDRLEIRVEDTGIGIPEDVRSRIFNPFFTTRPVGEAAGQGLAIAQASVGRLGGTITFQTETGRGTTFIVRLPLN
jgi:signal transduction histidine kinase